jgi:Fe-S cluster biogenesis protein NfuA
MADTRGFEQRLQRLESLLREAQDSDEPAKSRLQEVARAVLDLHAVGLERLLELLAEMGKAGEQTIDACVRDDLVSGLLLLHGLHPLDTDERVRLALDAVRPYLRSHGGNVELVEVRDETVRLRVEGTCHSCPSSAETMRQTVEEAIYAKAPEVTAVEVETSTQEALSFAFHGARVALPVV